MTVEETLSIASVAAAGRGSEKEQLDNVHTLFPRLSERLKCKIRYLSGGEQQMVAIAVGLLGAPKLMILDDPTLGLSPKLRRELCTAAAAIKGSGVPLILIDQDVNFLTELIDRLYLFDYGRISSTTEKQDIPSHEGLMAMLFGEHIT